MLARGVRNVIYNYTDAQRKVRSATSNDAWGPSPALMHEIADLTDNVVAYAEIMPSKFFLEKIIIEKNNRWTIFDYFFLVVWKRLNDHGKNWRHVYKSLVLLDHLIKYGNERVSQQCKENIFAIQTLKDFQYVEEQKDQGYNVREKAKQLVALLKDDERLRNERRKAQEGRERYVRQAIGMDSNGAVTYGRPTTATMRRNSIEGSDPYGGASYLSGQNTATAYRSTSYNDSLHTATVRGFVQPSSQEEEQLQMQIALAESQREVS
jgi:epsin